MTTTKSQLVASTYSTIINEMKRAKTAIHQGDIQTRFRATSRAINLLNELFQSLDFESGGEIAENLGFIYCHIMYNMGRVNSHNDTAALDNAIKLLTPLESSWKQLASQFDSIEDETEFLATHQSASATQAAALSS